MTKIATPMRIPAANHRLFSGQPCILSHQEVADRRDDGSHDDVQDEQVEPPNSLMRLHA